MNKWDARFLDLAELVSTWSKAPSIGVGAVIVDHKRRVVSLGFNGFPRTVSDNVLPLLDRDERIRRTIHAEVNALLFAGRSVDGCTLYVTHPPCAQCAAKLIQSGIVRIVAPMPDEHFEQRWSEDVRSASALFEESGVVCQYIEY